MAIVPFQSFADSSCRDIIERHVQRAQSLMHIAEFAALSGSSNETEKLLNNFN